MSGGLAPVLNLSANYEQRLDGSYSQGRVYARADNRRRGERLRVVIR